MIFSKEEIILAYTIEKCPKCEKFHKRDFSEGDILFNTSSTVSYTHLTLPTSDLV